MQFKAPHITGLALSGAGILATVASGLHWLSSNVTVEGAKVCADGLPTGVVGIVSGLVTVAGVLVLLVAPSVKPSVNLAAVAATTVPS